MLTAEQVGFYREQGYLLVKGVLPAAEVRELRAEADAIFERARRLGRNLEGRWPGSWQQDLPADQRGAALTLTSVHNVQEHCARFTRLLVDERFTSVLTPILGPNVQLHHTKMHLKPPETGTPFPLHQDYSYFPHRDHTMLAAVLHLDRATVANGCLRVVPGSHRWGPLAHRHEGAHFLPLDQYPIESAQPCEAEAGDLLFFSYLTVHGSGLNRSRQTRCILLVQVRAPTDQPIPQQAGADQQQVPAEGRPGQGTMLAGINPLVPFQFRT
jgi:ectoine hydroxylase-related dioxygenase (phytanoyl-CoA dioxygenase family)